MKIYCAPILFAALTSHAASWFASTTGTAGGDGSIGNPWDIYTAFSATNSIVAGDVLNLRGGTYTNDVSDLLGLYLVGSTNNNILIRPYPGEHAIITTTGTNQNHNITEVYGSYCTISNLEIYNQKTDRVSTTTYVYGMAMLDGTNNTVVDCSIHDSGVGIWLGNASRYNIIANNYLYMNGYQGGARGHGIYGRSSQKTTLIKDNIVFDQSGLGFQLYSTSSGVPIDGFQVEGNTVFNNGALSDTGLSQYQIIIDGGGLVDDTSVISNFFIGDFTGANNAVFGSGLPGDTRSSEGSIFVYGNHFVGNYVAAYCFTNVTFTNNFVSGGSTLLWYIFPNDQSQLTKPSYCSYLWDRNTYNLTFAVPFRVSTNGVFYSFSQWQSMNGIDQNSTFSSSLPTSSEYYVRPSSYVYRRANVTIINWAMSDNVMVDLSSAVSMGHSYEVLNSQNPLSPRLFSGTYSGPISFPMTNLSVATPVGLPTPSSTGPFFASFVVNDLGNPINTTISSLTVSNLLFKN